MSIVVPGLMGSQLVPEAPAAPFPTICCGSTLPISARASSACSPCPAQALEACGPVLHGYLPLEAGAGSRRLHRALLRLRLATRYHRIRRPARTAALPRSRAREISVIAHSMGGLVARIALRSRQRHRASRG